MTKYFAEIIDSNEPHQDPQSSNEKCQILSQDFLIADYNEHKVVDFEMISAKSLNNQSYIYPKTPERTFK